MLLAVLHFFCTVSKAFDIWAPAWSIRTKALSDHDKFSWARRQRTSSAKKSR